MKTVKSGTAIIAEPKRTTQKGELMRAIDADALIETFEDRLEKIRNRYGDYSGEAGVCAGALHLIREQPTIEPERKTGKWIVHYECPKCGEITKDFTECCPFCGAEMGGSE